MKIVFGDLWKHPADVVLITTNGSVKKDGKAVMGRGVALQARQRFPDMQLDKVLGKQIRKDGLKVSVIGEIKDSDRGGVILMSFPVKYRWYDKADLKLIESSTIQLEDLAKRFLDKTFVLPRPGCGNGGLNWKDVKPILQKYLPDNVHVITNG